MNGIRSWRIVIVFIQLYGFFKVKKIRLLFESILGLFENEIDVCSAKPISLFFGN